MQLANQTFTMRAHEKAAFHPWTFEKRMEDVTAVQTFLERCPDSWNQTRRHDAVLSFLAKERKSRQETEPALGKLIQSATVDPLHAMNNVWEHLLSCIVSPCFAMSNIWRHADLAIQPDTPIACFMAFIKNSLHLHRLHRKLDDWLKDDSCKDISAKALHIRLTGLESRKFCQNVMLMMGCLLPAAHHRTNHLFVVHALTCIGLLLHDAVSLFSRYVVSMEQVDELEQKCRKYFNACVLFLPRPVTPTIWTIGHVIPKHTRKLREEIGFGLGIGTTQGREGKVQVAKE